MWSMSVSNKSHQTFSSATTISADARLFTLCTMAFFSDDWALAQIFLSWLLHWWLASLKWQEALVIMIAVAVSMAKGVNIAMKVISVVPVLTVMAAEAHQVSSLSQNGVGTLQWNKVCGVWQQSGMFGWGLGKCGFVSGGVDSSKTQCLTCGFHSQNTQDPCASICCCGKTTPQMKTTWSIKMSLEFTDSLFHFNAPHLHRCPTCKLCTILPTR